MSFTFQFYLIFDFLSEKNEGLLKLENRFAKYLCLFAINTFRLQ
jgi:hypothetical protein